MSNDSVPHTAQRAAPSGEVWRLSSIVARLGGELSGEDKPVRRVAGLDAAGPEDISFITHPRYRAMLDDCAAGTVIVRPDLVEAAQRPGRSLLVTDDPYLYFARLQQLLHPPAAPRPGVDARAVLGADVSIGPGTEVAALVCVGDRVRIGARCRLMAGVVIGDDVPLGDDVVLHPQVTIYAGTRLGHRVQVHSGAVIGADGFGLAWDGQQWQRIPHLGGVWIQDDVEIGANTTIDRGALADTIIETGVRIDNLVQIAHNVQVGAHTAIAACAGVAGSARIGARCRIGGAAMIAGHLEIPADTTISPGSLVPVSLKEAGHYTGLYPLTTHRDWRMNAAQTRQLGRLVDRVRQVERACEALASGQPSNAWAAARSSDAESGGEGAGSGSDASH